MNHLYENNQQFSSLDKMMLSLAVAQIAEQLKSELPEQWSSFYMIDLLWKHCLVEHAFQLPALKKNLLDAHNLNNFVKTSKIFKVRGIFLNAIGSFVRNTSDITLVLEHVSLFAQELHDTWKLKAPAKLMLAKQSERFEIPSAAFLHEITHTLHVLFIRLLSSSQCNQDHATKLVHILSLLEFARNDSMKYLEMLEKTLAFFDTNADVVIPEFVNDRPFNETSMSIVCNSFYML